MPRRNNRRETVPPLDLTPADIPPPQPKNVRPWEPRPRVKTRAERENENAERQLQARMRRGIDWNICLVPGCGEPLQFYGRAEYRQVEYRDPNKRLPLCIRHQLIVWHQVQGSRDIPGVIEANNELIRERQERADAEHEAAKRAHLAKQDGHIYYIRLNGLIKAGWTRSLHNRLRAYGPDVEILCHHKGSRQDETTLHRNLRPFLARGREWYEDCDGMRDIIAKAVERHGEPYIEINWTSPAEPPIKVRRR